MVAEGRRHTQLFVEPGHFGSQRRFPARARGVDVTLKWWSLTDSIHILDQARYALLLLSTLSAGPAAASSTGSQVRRSDLPQLPDWLESPVLYRT